MNDDRRPRINGHSNPEVAAMATAPAAAPVASSGRDPTWSHVKVVVDFILAVLLFVVLAPVILLLMALVRLTSRGPAVFCQKRVGRGGRVFTMYKLRTMRIDAEARSGAVWAGPHDARCTALGQRMRSLHLDELPQLLNVLRGEMALVGPRPERPEFVLTLAEEIPGYLDRLAVRPGITGLAQILLPPDQDVSDVERKLVVDLYYIQTSSVGMDIKIVLFTGLRLLRIPAALCSRLVRLPAVEAIPGLVRRFAEQQRRVPTPKPYRIAEPEDAGAESEPSRDPEPITRFSTLAPMFLRTTTEEAGPVPGRESSL